MIELIKVVRKIIDICTQLMRSCLFIYIIDHFIEFHYLKHQRLLCIILSRSDRSVKNSAILSIFLEDRLNSNDCIKNIRSCISLKGSKSVNIKDIILRSLVRKISVLDRCKSNFFCCTSCIFFLYCTVVHDLLIHLIINLTDQILKTHNTAFSCLKRLTIFSVHCTKSKECKFCLRFYNSCLLRTTEYLHKMQFLTLINNIDHLIWIIQFLTFYQCSKICCIIQRSSVRFQNHTRRNLFFICLFCNVYYKRTLIIMCESFLLEHLNHIRNICLGICFTFPEIKIYTQSLVVLLQVSYRHIHDMFPDCTISFISIL